MLSTIAAIPNKIINSRGFDFFNVSDDKQFHLSTKFLLIFWLIAISLIWGLVRSHFSHQVTLNSNLGTSVPLSLCFIFIGLFAFPAFLMVRSTQRLLWLLGASIVTSSLPDIPAAPYINEGAHMIFMITGLALVITKRISLSEVSQNKVFKLFLGYIIACVLSVLINKFTGGSAWQFKAGIVQLVLYFSFAIVVAAFIMHGAADNNSLKSLIDGYVWGVLGQIIFITFILPLIFQTSFIAQNDTVIETKIWQQLQAASTEPNTGLLFAVSLPLIIWWLSVQEDRVAQYIVTGILLLMPWLMIFSGSQLARLVGISALVFCLFRYSLRRHALPILLSCVLSFFYYQSFPLSAQTIGNMLDGTSTKVRTIFKLDTLGRGDIARLKIDPDAAMDNVLLELRASNTLSTLNSRVNKKADALDDPNSSVPALLDNAPPLTEIAGMPLKLESTIDPTFVSPLKQQLSEKLNALASNKNSFHDNGWQANSLIDALSVFMSASLTSKIVGFGAGTGEYRAGNVSSSQVGIVKVFMETGLLGILFLSGFILLLLTGLWKKSKSKQNEDMDIFFVITIALAIIFCSAFVFSLQNWGFAMVICIMAIIALLMNSKHHSSRLI